MRKQLSKKTRRLVYEKYGGHCAYCGCEMEYGDMQVDHMETFGHAIYKTSDKAVKMVEDGSIDDIRNLMPSCRQCNFYKGINNLEQFRDSIKYTLSCTCKQSFQVRLAMKYGILAYTEWDGKFYFEKGGEK